MSYKIVINTPTPSTVPLNGWTIGYRILGSTDAYITSGPYFAMPVEITTTDAVGTLYEGYIKRDCGTSQSTDYFWQTPCNCVGAGYTSTGTQCKATVTAAPTVTNSGYCLATAVNNVYSSFGTRIYTPGFTNAELSVMPIGSAPHTYAGIDTGTQWGNALENPTDGPMNRDSVWIDSDCDGVQNAVVNGVETTISTVYNNTTSSNKTIYIGCGGDNLFKLIVNGVEIANTPAGGDTQFKIWHIFPVVVVPGGNYINIIGTSSGAADAVAMVVYDNTPAQIAAATSDFQLTIPFRTGALRGTSFDVATCPATYSLDSSAGTGNYTCVKTNYKTCNTIS